MTSMSDVAPATRAFPVSVKGVLVRDGRVLLLKNEREEWEPPGGKLELGEEPQVCVAREITEETGLAVTVGPILDAWQYHIGDGSDVLIVTYGCHPERNESPGSATSTRRSASSPRLKPTPSTCRPATSSRSGRGLPAWPPAGNRATRRSGATSRPGFLANCRGPDGQHTVSISPSFSQDIPVSRPCV